MPGMSGSPKAVSLPPDGEGLGWEGSRTAGSGLGATHSSSRATICSRSSGLARKAFMPTARAASCSSAITPAVRAMMGSPVRPRSSRINRVAVSPSITGIRTSISTAANPAGLALRICTAC